MSFLTQRPGITVAEHRFGHAVGVHHRCPIAPLHGFAGQQGFDRTRHGFHLTAEIATAITAN